MEVNRCLASCSKQVLRGAASHWTDTAQSSGISRRSDRLLLPPLPVVRSRHSGPAMLPGCSAAGASFERERGTSTGAKRGGGASTTDAYDEDTCTSLTPSTDHRGSLLPNCAPCEMRTVQNCGRRPSFRVRRWVRRDLPPVQSTGRAIRSRFLLFSPGRSPLPARCPAS
jgi:hypothetical protein